MPVKPCVTVTDLHQHETVNHGTPMFPCAAYSFAVGDSITKSIPWHWHEEAEAIAVTRGVLRVDIPGQSFLVREGEGFFINSSVLQTAVDEGDGPCAIQSLVFHPGLIAGQTAGALEQKYVRPLLDCAALPAVHLHSGESWRREGAACILEAFAAYRDEPYGYEFAVREGLSRLWRLIAAHHQGLLRSHTTAKNLDALRAKDMLTFIHAHYAEDITLADIAAAAAVSPRECLRCFGKTIGLPPMKYLLRHRVSVAAGLLGQGDKSVTEVGKAVGFDSPSYFSLVFKRLTGMTPSQYRSTDDESK